MKQVCIRAEKTAISILFFLAGGLFIFFKIRDDDDRHKEGLAFVMSCFSNILLYENFIGIYTSK